MVLLGTGMDWSLLHAVRMYIAENACFLIENAVSYFQIELVTM